MTVVRIPPTLRADTAGQPDIEVPGATVREVLGTLLEAFPSLEGRILREGEIPRFLNVFVDGTDVRIRQGLDTPVGPTSTVLLLPAMAGG